MDDIPHISAPSALEEPMDSDPDLSFLGAPPDGSCGDGVLYQGLLSACVDDDYMTYTAV